MPDTPLRNRLSALLAQRPPRHTLPQAFYTDPEIFDLDMRTI